MPHQKQKTQKSIPAPQPHTEIPRQHRNIAPSPLAFSKIKKKNTERAEIHVPTRDSRARPKVQTHSLALCSSPSSSIESQHFCGSWCNRRHTLVVMVQYASHPHCAHCHVTPVLPYQSSEKTTRMDSLDSRDFRRILWTLFFASRNFPEVSLFS